MVAQPRAAERKTRRAHHPQPPCRSDRYQQLNPHDPPPSVARLLPHGGVAAASRRHARRHHSHRAGRRGRAVRAAERGRAGGASAIESVQERHAQRGRRKGVPRSLVGYRPGIFLGAVRAVMGMHACMHACMHAQRQPGGGIYAGGLAGRKKGSCASMHTV
eukprot:360763-Chlamydomonas_euryale.AAC.6